ncbi:hypothetical protein ABBQ32_006780 [Trebouxia sp. C0010 RCD-2024]
MRADRELHLEDGLQRQATSGRQLQQVSSKAGGTGDFVDTMTAGSFNVCSSTQPGLAVVAQLLNCSLLQT